MAKSISNILQRAQELALQLRQSAAAVDASFEPPRAQLEAMAQAGIFRFAAVAQPGERRRLLERLASGCGASSFLSTQHQGACRRLRAAGHSLLDQAVDGQAWVGVCFAHLRRPVSPIQARQVRGGFEFEGKAPWFSGYGLMTHVLVGGALPDGRFVMCLSEFDRKEIQPGELMRLAVMNAAATVPVTFERLWLPADSLVVESDPDDMHSKDMHSTVYQSARSLGVVRAAREFLPAGSAAGVAQRAEQLHQDMDAWDDRPEWPGATELRCRAIELATATTSAALMAVGGRSHALTHPLQRLCREASFYNTTQLTEPLKTTGLRRLTG